LSRWGAVRKAQYGELCPILAAVPVLRFFISRLGLADLCPVFIVMAELPIVFRIGVTPVRGEMSELNALGILACQSAVV
jgi:hypothetical protein